MEGACKRSGSCDDGVHRTTHAAVTGTEVDITPLLPYGVQLPYNDDTSHYQFILLIIYKDRHTFLNI